MAHDRDCSAVHDASASGLPRPVRGGASHPAFALRITHPCTPHHMDHDRDCSAVYDASASGLPRPLRCGSSHPAFALRITHSCIHGRMADRTRQLPMHSHTKPFCSFGPRTCHARTRTALRTVPRDDSSRCPTSQLHHALASDHRTLSVCLCASCPHVPLWPDSPCDMGD